MDENPYAPPREPISDLNSGYTRRIISFVLVAVGVLLCGRSGYLVVCYGESYREEDWNRAVVLSSLGGVIVILGSAIRLKSRWPIIAGVAIVACIFVAIEFIPLH